MVASVRQNGSVDIVLSAAKHPKRVSSEFYFGWNKQSKVLQQKMKFRILLVVFLVLASSRNHVESQETVLDVKFGPLFRLTRDALRNLVQPQTFARGLKVNIKNNRVQTQFPDDTPFPCDVNGPGARSKVVPNSVHKLTPGDIDVIGSIGDSLTAGNGAFAIDVLQVLLEGRGASWSIGGQQTWRQFLTLPNILKEFNPKLYGYSVADQAVSSDKASRFNVAEPGAMAIDTVHQARNLVKRIRSDPKVNMKKHWKMVTYMIGGNDFCLDVCYSPNQDKVLEKARNNLILALRILRKNLPRTLVNVVAPPNVGILTHFTNKPHECDALHYIECPCMFSLNHLRNRERTMNTIRRWTLDLAEIVKMPEFHDRSDFEVTYHPFLEHTDIPKDARGNTEFKYMSKDCFHLSQLGHARAANSLFNSLMTPENQRLKSWTKEFEQWTCPTSQSPFIATTKNS